MNYVAVLGRQPEISLAELISLGFLVRRTVEGREGVVAELVYDGELPFDINRLGGTQKLAVELTTRPLEVLAAAPEGKLTFGISDYSTHASTRNVAAEALKLKRILARHERSVRIVANKTAVLSGATVLHNGLSGKNPRKIELIRLGDHWYRTIGVQDIDAYARRDQARPARDAKVGMLPPKLAQILINLCGPLPASSRILDPFCGTGVVLQEALLMGYRAYGTDINERMIDYTKKNLSWLARDDGPIGRDSANNLIATAVGDATNFQWSQPIDAVACECYLGAPMSQAPSDIKLREQQQDCRAIILGFLKNLAPQIRPGTPVVLAAPAWLRADGTYARLEILDVIADLGYNVSKQSREGLIYHRNGQIVARDIIILRKK